MSLFDESLSGYLGLVAAKSATPGGGAVSAVVAANAAAMVSMVANLTLGKKGCEGAQEAAREALSGSTALIEDCEGLASRDMEAFDSLMRAWRLPRESEEEKRSRSLSMGVAAKEACEAPREICRRSLEILRLALLLAPGGNRSAISDLGVGALMAEAAFRGAALSIEINLASLEDRAYAAELSAWIEEGADRAAADREAALRIVRARMA